MPPQTAHPILLSPELEQIAAQAGSEVGMDVGPYLQKVVGIHLERIKDFQESKDGKHPMRCETCGNRERNVNDDDWCDIMKDWICGEIEWATTEKVGCGSWKPVDNEGTIREDDVR